MHITKDSERFYNLQPIYKQCINLERHRYNCTTHTYTIKNTNWFVNVMKQYFTVQESLIQRTVLSLV